MNTFAGSTAPRAPGLGAVAAYLVGMGGLAFTITILWLSMRAVMGIGGACATGGPYVPVVECPDGVVLLAPLSIFGIFIFGGLAAWGGASVGGRWVFLIALGWPALFLSLGWNFLEFGFNPPGGAPGELEWSWLFCGVIFVLMGGIPLLIGIRGAAEVAGSHRAYAGGRVLVGRAGNVDRLRELGELRDSLERAAAARSTETGVRTPPGSDTATRLERLARLRAAGDLTDTEFEAAKRATIEEGGT